jgi:predicted ATPase/class 3 adenylate cyclase
LGTQRGNMLPTGTVTFLFTDVVGNVPIWERDPTAMKAALARHHDILYAAVQHHHGLVFKILGDEFQIAFDVPENALEAALEAQRGLRDEPWGSTGPLMVRMGLHTGPAEVIEGVLDTPDYAVSHTINRVARIRTAAHGGQILLSSATSELLHGYRHQDIHLLDMGDVYLKGMSLPEHLYQVVVPDLPDVFPPLVSISHPLHNLPIQLTSFIGREKEIKDIKAFLHKDDSEIRPLTLSRLVTLTGVGGTGKTRLALHVATDLVDEYPDGLWLVELARITNPSLIPHTAAAVFGLRDEKGRSAAEMLDNYLRLKRLLFILDNCEHVINEAAQFADHILHLAPGVKILATSREALGLAGEAIYLVPSLGKPDLTQRLPLESLIQYEAVQLFIDRAVAVLSSFTVTNANAPAVAQICHRLDGIPLAIELAAARIKALSVQQIAARLNDRFRLLTGGSRTALPRQQTLQATIDWSYGLLSEQERTLFRCLSVFTGGWALEAAEAVSSGASNLDPAIVLDLLSQLLNKSMVIASGEEGQAYRYRMLETIRQYAQEKLIEAGEAARARDQHLAYFLVFAEEMESQLKTARQMVALDQLDLEINNIRSAVSWAFSEEQGDSALLGLRLVNAIGLFLELRNFHEVMEWLEKGLSLLQGEDELHVRVRAAAYSLMGWCYTETDLSEAKRWLQESVILYRSSRDSRGLAFALTTLGSIHAISDPMRNSSSTDIEAAWSCYKESETIFCKLHDPWGMSWVLSTKLGIFYFAKDFASFSQLVEENRAAFQNTEGRVFPEFYNVHILAIEAFERADYQKAYFFYRSFVELSLKLRSRGDAAYGLMGMGIVAFTQGDFQKMAEHFEEALLISREVGYVYFTYWILRYLSIAALAQGQVERARNYLLESTPQNLEKENTGEMVNFILYAVGVIDAEGYSEHAAKLLGMINFQLESVPDYLDVRGQKVFQWITALVHSHLDDAAFAAAWAEGHKLTLEQALEEALAFCRQDAVENATGV